MTSDRSIWRVAVVGGGIVGLSAAWHLQDAGVDVDVLDAGEPGRGASYGNAGWITPDLVEPLPSPAALRSGAIGLLRPGSPVRLGDMRPSTLRLLTALALASTPGRSRRSAEALRPLAGRALAAYDELAGCEGAATTSAPVLAVFSSTAAAERFVNGHADAADHLRPLDREQSLELEPALGSDVEAGVLIESQRFVDPYAVTAALAADVQRRGGRVRTSHRVAALEADSAGVYVRSSDTERYDAVVVAAGVDSASLVRAYGVRVPLAAGRGYSFSTARDGAPALPVYIPERRLACTPLPDGYRVVGVMEFGSHGRRPRSRRIDDMAAAAAPFLRAGGEALEPRDQWVGSRPCTPDGLPLIGATSSPRIHVATGHGMWGVTLGPVSGELVRDSVLGRRPAVPLAPFSPLR